MERLGDKNSQAKFIRRSRPLLTNFLLWILGIVWVYAPYSIDVFLHETGHAILALSTGSEVVEFNPFPPDPHVTIQHPSSVARNISLFGGFLFTFIPYISLFSYFVLKKKKWANFMIWPLLATFPGSLGDFEDLGLSIPSDRIYLIYQMGTLILFFFLNRKNLLDIFNVQKNSQSNHSA